MRTTSAVLALLLLGTAVPAQAGPDKAPTMVGRGMGAVVFLRYAPSGKELVRICQFGGVEILDVGDFTKMRTFDVGMRMIAFSPDGGRIASAEGTDGARLWDAALPGKKVPLPPGTPLTEVRVLEAPLHVLEAPSSAGRNGGETRRDRLRVFRAEFSTDGKRVVTTQANGRAKVWNADSGALESELALGEGELRAAAFSPDGKSVLVGDAEGVLHEWSFEKKEDVKTASDRGAVMEIVLSPDGRLLATAHRSESGASVVFRDEARKVLETKEGWTSVALSKDGKALAIGGARIEFLDPATRKTVRIVELPAVTLGESNPELANGPNAGMKLPVSVVALSFSPDGTTLAAGLQDGTIRLVPTAP